MPCLAYPKVERTVPSMSAERVGSDQEPGRDLVQLPDVPETERPRNVPNVDGAGTPAEQPVHPAVPQHLVLGPPGRPTVGVYVFRAGANFQVTITGQCAAGALWLCHYLVRP